MAFECFGSYRGEAMPAGEAFEVYSDGVENPAPKLRKPRSDKGVARGPRKAKVVKAVKVKAKGKRSPGRPRVFNGRQRIVIAAALRKYGLTKGIEYLEAKRSLKISLTTARSVAEEFQITFVQGRPAKAA
jgi:hypothetical protein